MLIGLSNAYSIFERFMEYVIASMQAEICIVYLDDIVIFSRTLEEHLARLQTVFFLESKKLVLKSLIKNAICFIER